MSTGLSGAEIKVLVSIQNQERIQQLNRQIAEQAKLVKDLNDRYKGKSLDQFFVQAAPNAKKLRELNAELATLQRSQLFSGGGTRASMGLMAVGQMVDDMQYGFRSIVNNIPQVAMLLTGSTGIGGAAAIAAVAVNQLVQHWDQLIDMFRSSWLNVPADQLEKLRIQADKASDAFAKLMKTPSQFEARQLNALTDAITGGEPGGAANIVKGVRESIAAGVIPGLKPEMTDEQTKRLANARQVDLVRGFGAGKNLPLMADKVQREINEEMNQALAKATEDLIGKALIPGEEGFSARATLRQLIAKNPKAFSEKFRERMEATSDQAVEHAQGNARTAQALMRGPFGTQMRMRLGEQKFYGGGPPMTNKQILSLLRDTQHHIRLGGREEAGLMNTMQDAKLSLEEGRFVMSGLRNKDVNEYARKTHMPLNKAIETMFKERLNTVTQRRGKPMPNELERPVRQFLKQSGIDDADAPGVLREARKINKKEIQETMLQHGFTDRGQAERYLLHQREQQLMGSARGGQWVGLTQFARMTPEKRLPDIAEKQLAELKSIKDYLSGQKRPINVQATALNTIPGIGGMMASGAVNVAVAAAP